MGRVLAALLATAMTCVACGDDSSSTYDASADVTVDSTLDGGEASVEAGLDADDADADAADALACAGPCDGSLPVCLDGACVACAPGSTKCAATDASTTAATCDDGGTWQSTTCAQPSPDCDAGTCVCAGAVCGGVCIDVSSDSANCGRCGHDCCGGACVGGQCQPVVVANGGYVVGLAVDSTDVYWVAANGQVMKCSKTGCVTPTVLASQQGYPPTGPALDANDVYWITDTGTVRSCSKQGCTAPTTFWAPGPNQNVSGASLVVSGATLYWASGGSILQCATSGCAGDGGAPAIVVSGQAMSTPIAVDSTDVYWGVPFPTDTIDRCPLGGCGNLPTTYATGQRIADILLDATTVYWSNAQTGDVMSCAKSLCLTPSVVTHGAYPYLGQDANYVYWVSNGFPQEIFACPKTGKCTVPLEVSTALGQYTPYSNLVTDDACIYWGAQSYLLKTAKP